MLITTTTAPSGDPLALALIPVPPHVLSLDLIDTDLAAARIASSLRLPTMIHKTPTPTPRSARTHLALEHS